MTPPTRRSRAAVRGLSLAEAVPRSSRSVAVVVIGLCGLLSASCSGSSDGDSKLTVLAASSLTETFTAFEAAYEKDHPGVNVVTSFGSSTTLAEQIVNGAPADVIATADETSTGIVKKAGLLQQDPVPFATNTMVIATPPDNPGDVNSVRDLQSVDFVMCDPSAPCGAAGQQVLTRSGVTANPRSLEVDARSVLSKVTLGEADAGLVYVTDARAAGNDVATIPIPTKDNAVNTYYIAAIKGSAGSELAGGWLSLVTSRAGDRVLRSAGFGRP